MFGCGIKAVEMYGDENDWASLANKLATLKKTLEPVLNHLWLPQGWWECAEDVFHNLARTRKDPNHSNVIDFWSRVLTQTQNLESGGVYGMGVGKKYVDAYDGWLIQFLTGQKLLRVDEAIGGGEKPFSGLNEVPVTVNSLVPTSHFRRNQGNCWYNGF